MTLVTVTNGTFHMKWFFLPLYSSGAALKKVNASQSVVCWDDGQTKGEGPPLRRAVHGSVV